MDLKQFYTVLGKQMFSWGVLLVLTMFAIVIAVLIKPADKDTVTSEVEDKVVHYQPASPGMNAAEGKALFKTNCASCHKIDKESTGPMLQGARQRWVDAGEGDLIYAFIRDNKALRESDSSIRAKEIFSAYNGAAMNAFPSLTNEDIDNILFYSEQHTVLYEGIP